MPVARTEDAAAGSRRLRVAAEVDRLSEVRSFIRDSVAAYGGSTRVAADLVQAVDEAVCNVMVHGYAGKPGKVEIEAAAREGQIEIRILDRAPTFDPTAVPPHDPARPTEGVRPGGMGVGVHLLRTMTDAVHHAARPDGGNELTLVRSIDGPGEED